MNFKKTKEYLVCIDSDGCAIDTMTIKHQKCFGPVIIEVWKLQEFQTDILKRWDDINLFSITRGINRFKGLAKMLEEINEKYTPIAGIEGYINWIETTKQFSNEELSNYIKDSDNICSIKALEWSVNVNKAIDNLDDSLKLAFKGCYESMQKIQQVADIAVVSSANRKAIEEEWEQNNLLSMVDGVLAQDVGTKGYCIGKLLELGYKKENVVKIGDAVGDLEAAKSNSVNFYPMLLGKEAESWNEFSDTALEKLINHEFEDYGKVKEEQFYNQFKGK